LSSQFHPPEYDIDFYNALVDRVREKSSLDDQASIELATKIAVCVGFLCSAFEEGFIERVDTKIGNESYSLRVYLMPDINPAQ
jgi:hypothetical protein